MVHCNLVGNTSSKENAIKESFWYQYFLPSSPTSKN